MFKETSHINLIEFLWFMLGIVGISFSLLAFRNAYRDKTAVELAELHDSEMKIIAQTNLATEGILVVLNALVISIGAISFYYAPSPYPFTIFGWIITVVLLLIPFCAVTISLLERRMRVKLMKGKR